MPKNERCPSPSECKWQFSVRRYGAGKVCLLVIDKDNIGAARASRRGEVKCIDV